MGGEYVLREGGAVEPKLAWIVDSVLIFDFADERLGEGDDCGLLLRGGALGELRDFSSSNFWTNDAFVSMRKHAYAF